MISGEGISVDLGNIEVILSWPAPQNTKDICIFIGLASYYRRFVEGFSRIAAPITTLQKNGVIFEWTKECEEAFNDLKKCLTIAPILKVPNMDKDFVVCIDASGEGLGACFDARG